MASRTDREKNLSPLYPVLYEPVVRRALEEDLGRAGDLTTDAIIPPDTTASAHLIARREGCIAGLEVSASAFRLLAESVRASFSAKDGDHVSAGSCLAKIEGPARAILSAERVALNFLGHLSGVATTTSLLVAAVEGYKAGIACTRKTTPGLRALEKYAVRAGGGSNHRFGLDDAVLIKDNHLVVARGISRAVERIRQSVGHMVKVQLEVDTLDQLREGLSCPIDAVLLDNMSPEVLREAVEIVGGKVITEASGNITVETARDIAAAGVDLISAGWLTHSAPSLDVSLEIEFR